MHGRCAVPYCGIMPRVGLSHVAPQSCEMFCGFHPSTELFLPPAERSVPLSSSGTMVEWRDDVRPPMSCHVTPLSLLLRRKLSPPFPSRATNISPRLFLKALLMGWAVYRSSFLSICGTENVHERPLSVERQMRKGT